MYTNENSKIFIVGAGIAGLTIAHRFAQHGLHPTIIDVSDVAASGSTTRNEGWLHAGTFHSQSISDPEQALRVARRCMYGHDQYRSLSPESIESPMDSTIAITLHKNRIPEILERWNVAGVHYKAVSKNFLESRSPHIITENIEAAWEVREVAINTRILCNRLIAGIEAYGGKLYCGAETCKLKIEDSSFFVGQQKITIHPSVIIITAGYQTAYLAEKYLETKLNMRYWKAHLLLTKRIAGCNIYGIDGNEANIAHHRNKTMVGMNLDNILCSTPSHEVVPACVDEMKIALSRFIQIPEDSVFEAIACMKVDVANDPRKMRSLDVEIAELSNNVYCALPGKMTESPFLADEIVKEILMKNDFMRVYQRPIDLLNIK